jgi:hypothetical protein
VAAKDAGASSRRRSRAKIQRRISDRFGIAHPQHAHINLLRQVGGISFGRDAAIKEGGAFRQSRGFDELRLIWSQAGPI